MNAQRFAKLYRIFAALAVLAVLVAAVPAPVQAAAVPTFSIVKVVQDESITIRTYNFPAWQLFTVRMDVVGKAAADGIIITQTNSGAGGSFEETYRIPAELKGKLQIAVRLESSNGFYAYNWFNNVTSSIPSSGSTSSGTITPTTTPSTVFTPKGPYVRVAGVVSNKTVTLDVYNFPANTDFRVRIGPFYNFWKGSVIAATISTGNGGNFRTTINLPDAVRGVDLVTVRLDASGGYYAYNAFHNVTASSGTPAPGSTTSVSGYACQITRTDPQASIVKSGEFDAKWIVKNTGDKTWTSSQIDYKYLYGTQMQKYEKLYDLPKTVKPGESITIIVDMVAPKYSGYYSTTWGLAMSSTTICNLPLTIYVK